MADNNGTITEGEVLPINIGGTDYTPTELESLITDGQFKRDVEAKQNTKLDKLNGAYVKLTQDAKTWETERTELQQLRDEKAKANQPQPEFDEATIAKAQEEARKLGLYTESDVRKLVEQDFPKYYSQQRQADKLLEGMEGLEKEITGEDGRPKFVLEDVLTHIKETGIKDPLKAYKDLYEAELDTWKEKKLSGAKREGIFSESGSTAGGKQPAEVKVTRENVGKLVREALNGS